MLAREVVAWKWLEHENVLPFVGVTRGFAIVSDFMENENIMKFIAKHPRHNRFSLVRRIGGRCILMINRSCLAQGRRSRFGVFARS